MKRRLVSKFREAILIALLLAAVATVVSGCLVVPAGPYGYGPAPAVVAPAPVVVAPPRGYAWGWHHHYWR